MLQRAGREKASHTLLINTATLVGNLAISKAILDASAGHKKRRSRGWGSNWVRKHLHSLCDTQYPRLTEAAKPPREQRSHGRHKDSNPWPRSTRIRIKDFQWEMKEYSDFPSKRSNGPAQHAAGTPEPQGEEESMSLQNTHMD